MIENQTLFDQMLPPIYQQNNASIMRTNYPGYFTPDEAPRRYGTTSDIQSDTGLLVRLFHLKQFIHTYFSYLRFTHLIEFGQIIKNVLISNVPFHVHFH
jgi:hypothetical protein